MCTTVLLERICSQAGRTTADAYVNDFYYDTNAADLGALCKYFCGIDVPDYLVLSSNEMMSFFAPSMRTVSFRSALWA